MKRICVFHIHQRGFTLIEVIVTLVVMAILGTMLTLTAGKNLAHSVTPVTTSGELLLLEEEVSVVTARYYSDMAQVNAMTRFKSFLDGNANAHFTLSHSGFDDGDGVDEDILKVEIQSNALGTCLVTLMPDMTK